MKFEDYIKQNNISYAVTKLNCRKQGLTDLVGIEKFTKLIHLDLDSNNLTSLPSLDSLTCLLRLHLENNNLPKDYYNLPLEELKLKVKKDNRNYKIDNLLDV